jgi:hypothetical protein
MRHPLEFVNVDHRKRFFITLLLLTLSLFTVFRVLDEPLQTDYAPNGIVSFELAGTPERVSQILISWEATHKAYKFAAFGLGVDYLFMPVYAFALAFGTLLAAGRHGGWLKSLGAVAGYGAFAAALFDAVENYALFQVLLGAFDSSYPMIAAVCATVKFGLLAFGLMAAIAGGVIPKSKEN